MTRSAFTRNDAQYCHSVGCPPHDDLHGRRLCRTRVTRVTRGSHVLVAKIATRLRKANFDLCPLDILISTLVILPTPPGLTQRPSWSCAVQIGINPELGRQNIHNGINVRQGIASPLPSGCHSHMLVNITSTHSLSRCTTVHHTACSQTR